MYKHTEYCFSLIRRNAAMKGCVSRSENVPFENLLDRVESVKGESSTGNPDY